MLNGNAAADEAPEVGAADAQDEAATFVVEVDGKRYQIPVECTHRKGRLNHGYFRGGRVICPLHYSSFDLKTGKCLNGPARDDLAPVCLEDGQGLPPVP